jgi:nucleoside-diphosphate-sugar epimerase
MCCSPGNKIVHVPHDHPQAEILRLLADTGKATRLLGWTAKTSLAQGLERTRKWLDENRWAW